MSSTGGNEPLGPSGVEITALVVALLSYLATTDRVSDAIANQISQLRNRRQHLSPYRDSENERKFLSRRISSGFERDFAALSRDRQEISNDALQALVKILIKERPDIVAAALVENLHAGDDSNASNIAMILAHARAAAQLDAAREDYLRQLNELEMAKRRLRQMEELAEKAQRRLIEENDHRRRLEEKDNQPLASGDD